MNRDEKAQAIEEIAAEIEAAEAIFAVDYRGISVPQAAELRGKLREADASFRIVKNRLTKIAAEKAGRESLSELLHGPTALTFVRGDTAMAAKAITTFNNEHEVLTYRGGFMGETTLDEERFKSIAKLPARDVLNGQFAGVVASPLTGLVRGLGSMIQGLALQLGQIAEKGLVTGEGPSDPSAGPVAEGGESSSQAAGDSPPPTPPADEAEEAPKDETADASDQPAAEPEAEAAAEAGEASSSDEGRVAVSDEDAASDEKASAQDASAAGGADEVSSPAASSREDEDPSSATGPAADEPSDETSNEKEEE